uniref:Protein A56 n=1 Tax=Raccoon poxvirus TaxID=10256 RepID=HEMA_RACVI|nr:RecName: Full=Protein A56; AltName: Full=Hemagglutinin; Flags: Precursor [Raccoonpox virus]AAA47231.1 hemagglutinin [Raccoonpox virus]AAN47049.1 hemagglutinin [Raccoonpox virus]AAN47050.1 hemagglutinin [Raccoonpox virus]AAN47051.1 hemagglutinin [Raccoonpox virus]
MKQLSIVILLLSIVYTTKPHPTQISKKLGDDATLSCNRNNTHGYLVMSSWYKKPDSIILLAAKNDVVYFDDYTADKVSYDSPYDTLATIITIKSLTSADAGTYICAFFITSTNDTDKIDYEEYFIDLVVNPANVSTIDAILSGSTTQQDIISHTEEQHDSDTTICTSESTTQISETSESTTSSQISETSESTSYGVEDDTQYNVTTDTTDNSDTIGTLPEEDTTTISTTIHKTTTTDDNLYDTYNEPISVSSSIPTTVESVTISTTKYTTSDFIEIFGIVSLILLLAVAIFCIIYYFCSGRSRKQETNIL